MIVLCPAVHFSFPAQSGCNQSDWNWPKKFKLLTIKTVKIFFRLLECKTFSLYLSKIWRKPLLNKGTMCITACGIFLKISAVPCLSFYYHENTHLGQKRTVASSNVNHLIPCSDSLSSPSAHAIQSSDIIYMTGTQSLRSCLKVDPEQVSNLFIPLPNHSWAFIQK